ncbi:MAG TPA: HD-GYP domain-containing protein [Solirubrobacteraceae bacterium]|nr:HD-GYP domain-containing protein [Solirubrobacteraceae bacterium]
MILATALVALVPAVAAWWLRDAGVLTSALFCLLFCLLLSLALSAGGAAYWKRRRHSADIMFSELLAWGWLRRLWRERQLRNLPALVQSATKDHHPDQQTVQRREQMLARLAAAIEAQDPYIDGHSRRVARHSEMIAAEMRLPAEQVARIRTAAALHDVGKLSTPREVLRKPGRLTDEEFELVKHHARDGAEMVNCLEDPELAAIVECHHERLDGSGYPDGLQAGQIPLGARIVAVADTFDAITAPRPYRPAAPHQRAFAVLSDEETSRLDPEVVQAFVRCYSGRRTIALWAALSALGSAALARTRGVLAHRRLSVRDLLSAMAAVGTAAVAATAAPLTASALHQQPAAGTAATAALNIASPPLRVPRHHATRAAVARPAKRAHAARATHHRRPRAAPRPAGQGSTGNSSLPLVLPPARSRSHRSAPLRQPPARTPTARRRRPPTTSPTASPLPTTPITAPTSTAAQPPPASPPSPPTSKQQCRDGGWKGHGFPNQGQCIDWVVHHGG